MQKIAAVKLFFGSESFGSEKYSWSYDVSSEISNSVTLFSNRGFR
jgi:hypothetical protein